LVYPPIIRDYFLEIAVLVVGANSKVGGLREVCALAALILGLDCLLLCTYLAAILGVMIEVSCIFLSFSFSFCFLFVLFFLFFVRANVVSARDTELCYDLSCCSQAPNWDSFFLSGYFALALLLARVFKEPGIEGSMTLRRDESKTGFMLCRHSPFINPGAHSALPMGTAARYMCGHTSVHPHFFHPRTIIILIPLFLPFSLSPISHPYHLFSL
jgi:hypothetical protein